MINVLYNSFNCNEQYHTPCNSSCNMNCASVCNHNCNVCCTPNNSISCTPNCSVSCTPNCNVSCTPNCNVSCTPNCTVSCTPNCSVSCNPNYNSCCENSCNCHHTTYNNTCCMPNIQINDFNQCLSMEQAILNICQTENSFFLSKANVIGCGLGTKIVNGCKTGERCIRVYVTKKLCINEISPENLVPLWYKGIRTDVVESGIVKTLSLTSPVRPVPAGYCVSAEGSTTMGTCGCLVKDALNGLYILGSAHVFTDYGTLSIGTTIVQPAAINGGSSSNAIANLSNAIPMSFTDVLTPPTVYFVDAAIGKVIDPSLVSPIIMYVGPPTGVGKANLDEWVKKVGATTELTNGQIDSVGTTIKIQLPNGNSVLFKEQVVTTVMGTTGDSGSVLLNKCNEAVGLACAGSGIVTVFNDMSKVLSALNVSLITSR